MLHNFYWKLAIGEAETFNSFFPLIYFVFHIVDGCTERTCSNWSRRTVPASFDFELATNRNAQRTDPNPRKWANIYVLAEIFGDQVANINWGKEVEGIQGLYLFDKNVANKALLDALIDNEHPAWFEAFLSIVGRDKGTNKWEFLIWYAGWMEFFQLWQISTWVWNATEWKTLSDMSLY